MAEKSEKKLTYSIPTHLSLPRRVLGPFTRLQLLVLFIGAVCSANLYLNFAFLDRMTWGFWIHLILSPAPLLFALLLTLVSFAGRSLGTWCVLTFLYVRQPREVAWKSVCRQDMFTLPIDTEEEKTNQ